MKMSSVFSKLSVVATTMILLLFLGGCLASLQLPTDAKNICTVSPSEFATWFESGAVTKDGVVLPANSINFPDIPNCSFYKWSEQMFLWLTSPAPPRYGGGGGRIFNSPAFYDVSPLDNGKRTFLPHQSGLPQQFNLRTSPLGPNKLPVAMEQNSRRLLEIEHPSFNNEGQQLILNRSGERVAIDTIILEDKRKPVFLGNDGKEIVGARPIIRPELDKEKTIQRFVSGEAVVFLGSSGNVIDVETAQANGLQVLMSQQGSLVYYQVTVNDVYAYFKTGVANGAIAANQFPTTQGELDDIENYALSKGKTLVDTEALAIEIKTAWVEASSLPSGEVDRFIILNATIPTYDKTTNPSEWIPNGQTVEKLAMIGMHVVGSAKGHPEMIWATFEHVSTAPNAAYSYINSSNQTVPVPQTTAGNWILCASNSAGPFNEAHMQVNAAHNIEKISPFTISASNTIRDNAWGALSSQTPNPAVSSTAESNTELISINNSVRSQLISGDVRINYIQTGSTWTIGGASPTGPFTGAISLGKEVGTSRMANPAMETYVQGTNCFSCHASNTVNVSAVWADLDPLFTP